MLRYNSGETLIFWHKRATQKHLSSPQIVINLLQIIHDSLWAMPVLSCLPLTSIPTVSFLLSFHCGFVYLGVFLAIFYYIQLSGNSFASNLTNISRNRWTCTTFAATTLVRSPSSLACMTVATFKWGFHLFLLPHPFSAHLKVWPC